MSVGFGFSVGDFLAALNLIGNVIDALRDSSHASSSFRSLIDELYALETALIHVKRLDPDICHTSEQVALQHAASQCRRSIDSFYGKLKRDQPHLQQGGTEAKVKDAWIKVKWAVCKKDDVENFRAEIRGHTSSITILLLTLHMRVTTTGKCEQKSSHKSLAAMIQGFSGQAMSALSTISNQIYQSTQQGKALLESSAQVVHTNLRIFQIVHGIHMFILQLPGQIQRQQPVYFTDPYNKESPFHLEFVRSPEALLAILKINLRESGCGPAMIDRGEFAIEELGTQRKVDLAESWDICFFPGQKVAMSMVFKEPQKGVKSSCPSCGTIQQEAAEQDITCTMCGAIFRRIEEMLETISETSESDSREEPKIQLRGPARPPKRKIREEDSASSNMRKFRRIQLINHIFYSKPLKCPVIDCDEGFEDQNGVQDHILHSHERFPDLLFSSDDQRSAPRRGCHSCNRTETGEWRRGPDGEGTLCNACGLQYEKMTRKLGVTQTVMNSSDRRPNPLIYEYTAESDSEYTAGSGDESTEESDADIYDLFKHDDIETLEYSSSEEEGERISGKQAVTSNLQPESVEEAPGLAAHLSRTKEESILDKFKELSGLEDSSDEEGRARSIQHMKRVPVLFLNESVEDFL